MCKVLKKSFLLIFLLGCNNSLNLTNQFTLTLNISGDLQQDTYLVKRHLGKWVNIDSSSGFNNTM